MRVIAVCRLASLVVLATLAIPAWAAPPILDQAGFDAAAYGAAQGYPLPRTSPTPIDGMIGFYSRYDRIRPLRPVPNAGPLSPLGRAEAAFSLTWTTAAGAATSLQDYLDRSPVTGLLIARGGTILYEHYRYGRTPEDRFVSQSMAKTLTGLLVGIALSEGKIHGIDDTAATYVPELAGTEYGATPIRHLLRMSSGVEYHEDYSGNDDSAKLGRMIFPRGAPGAVEAVKQFNHRTAPPGARFYYAGAETEILGLIVARATGTTLSDYLSQKIWAPMGMEGARRLGHGSVGPGNGLLLLHRDAARLGADRVDAGR